MLNSSPMFNSMYVCYNATKILVICLRISLKIGKDYTSYSEYPEQFSAYSLENMLLKGCHPNNIPILMQGHLVWHDRLSNDQARSTEQK